MSRRVFSHEKRSILLDKNEVHPFNSINLPLYLVAYTMLYWIVLCPIVYAAKLLFIYPEYGLYFFVIALFIYLVILGALVCRWRCGFNRDYRDDYYISYIQPKPVEYEDIDMRVLSSPSQVENDLIEKDTEVEIIVRSKERPSSLKLFDNARPISQNLISPLTPRELFFIDFIESAHKKSCDSTAEFIRMERSHHTDDPSFSYENHKKEEEFFIANVTLEENCTSEVFMFVNEVEAKQIEVELSIDEIVM